MQTPRMFISFHFVFVRARAIPKVQSLIKINGIVCNFNLNSTRNEYVNWSLLNSIILIRSFNRLLFFIFNFNARLHVDVEHGGEANTHTPSDSDAQKTVDTPVSSREFLNTSYRTDDRGTS